MENTIKKLYEGTKVFDGIYVVPVIDNICVSISKDCTNFTAWDDKGKDYTERLERTIAFVTAHPHTKDDKLLLVLQQFRDSFLGGAAGLEVSDSKDDIPVLPYDGKSDPIWKKLQAKFNVNQDRKLKIMTYGTTFIHETPKKCQCVFNAAIIRGNITKRSALQKKLVKLRGTDYRLQQNIRNTDLFTKFIEGVVEKVEKENLYNIAIICRAGHHRSVACAEMLVHLYPNRKVDHLTIHK